MNNYEVQKLVGEGSYGRAILCRRKTDKKLCIIKQISLTKLSRKEAKLTEQEALLLGKLQHPNIVTFWESFVSSQQLHIVMEYADGGDLDSHIKDYCRIHKVREIPEAHILNLFVQISLAIKYIHDRKILHRDLKSQNVFLTSAGVCKLGDFGVSKVLRNTIELAATQIGTPYYMSPEIMNNQRMPFTGKSMKQLCYNILHSTPAPPPATTTTYSKELRDLIRDTLIKDPKKRPGINNILNKAIIKDRIRLFLDDHRLHREFSHTVLHGQNVMNAAATYVAGGGAAIAAAGGGGVVAPAPPFAAPLLAMPRNQVAPPPAAAPPAAVPPPAGLKLMARPPPPPPQPVHLRPPPAPPAALPSRPVPAPPPRVPKPILPSPSGGGAGVVPARPMKRESVDSIMQRLLAHRPPPPAAAPRKILSAAGEARPQQAKPNANNVGAAKPSSPFPAPMLGAGGGGGVRRSFDALPRAGVARAAVDQQARRKSNDAKDMVVKGAALALGGGGGGGGQAGRRAVAPSPPAAAPPPVVYANPFADIAAKRPSVSPSPRCPSPANPAPAPAPPVGGVAMVKRETPTESEGNSDRLKRINQIISQAEAAQKDKETTRPPSAPPAPAPVVAGNMVNAKKPSASEAPVWLNNLQVQMNQLKQQVQGLQVVKAPPPPAAAAATPVIADASSGASSAKASEITSAGSEGRKVAAVPSGPSWLDNLNRQMENLRQQVQGIQVNKSPPPPPAAAAIPATRPAVVPIIRSSPSSIPSDDSEKEKLVWLDDLQQQMLDLKQQVQRIAAARSPPPPAPTPSSREGSPMIAIGKIGGGGGGGGRAAGSKAPAIRQSFPLANKKPLQTPPPAPPASAATPRSSAKNEKGGNKSVMAQQRGGGGAMSGSRRLSDPPPPAASLVANKKAGEKHDNNNKGLSPPPAAGPGELEQRRESREKHRQGFKEFLLAQKAVKGGVGGGLEVVLPSNTDSAASSPTPSSSPFPSSHAHSKGIKEEQEEGSLSAAATPRDLQRAALRNLIKDRRKQLHQRYSHEPDDSRVEQEEEEDAMVVEVAVPRDSRGREKMLEKMNRRMQQQAVVQEKWASAKHDDGNFQVMQGRSMIEELDHEAIHGEQVEEEMTTSPTDPAIWSLDDMLYAEASEERRMSDYLGQSFVLQYQQKCFPSSSSSSASSWQQVDEQAALDYSLIVQQMQAILALPSSQQAHGSHHHVASLESIKEQEEEEDNVDQNMPEKTNAPPLEGGDEEEREEGDKEEEVEEGFEEESLVFDLSDSEEEGVVEEEEGAVGGEEDSWLLGEEQEPSFELSQSLASAFPPKREQEQIIQQEQGQEEEEEEEEVEKMEKEWLKVARGTSNPRPLSHPAVSPSAGKDEQEQQQRQQQQEEEEETVGGVEGEAVQYDPLADTMHHSSLSVVHHPSSSATATLPSSSSSFCNTRHVELTRLLVGRLGVNRFTAAMQVLSNALLGDDPSAASMNEDDLVVALEEVLGADNLNCLEDLYHLLTSPA
eukprot:gene604-653_t